MKRKRERDKTATPTAEKWLSEKGSADNRERVFFPYRLGDDKTEYVDNVIKTLREKVKRHNSIAVVIAFVKGIPASYAKEVAERVAVRIEKEIDYDTNEKAFVIKPYIDISIGVIRELKRKREITKVASWLLSTRRLGSFY